MIEDTGDRLATEERFLDTAERLLIKGRQYPFHPEVAIGHGFLDQGFENGYQKIWYELWALSWNRPELKSSAMASASTTRCLKRSISPGQKGYTMTPVSAPHMRQAVVAMMERVFGRGGA